MKTPLSVARYLSMFCVPDTLLVHDADRAVFRHHHDGRAAARNLSTRQFAAAVMCDASRAVSFDAQMT